jgi:hypothetical protein
MSIKARDALAPAAAAGRQGFILPALTHAPEVGASSTRLTHVVMHIHHHNDLWL